MYKASTITDLIYLLKCSLNNQKADFARVSKMDLAEVFSLAEFHKLAACVSFALEDIEIDEKALKQYKQAKSMAIRKNILLNDEREQIYSYMEDEEIRHVSLKGIVMQKFYPKFGMREMGDNDILYDSTYQEQMYKFMISRGYHTELYKRSNHDEYLKSPVYNFELHNSLFMYSENKKFYEYYSDIMDRVISVTGKKYEFRFSDEDFYIYNIAHSYKHYSSGGTGLKILTDCYVYIIAKSKQLDFSYIENECEKLGIAGFEQMCRIISQKLFSCNSETIEYKLTEEEESFLNRMIISGAYGIQSLSIQSMINNLSESGKNTKFIKIKYYFKRVFVSLEWIRDAHPFFYRHKLLIPFLWVYRILQAITVNRKRIKSELVSVNETVDNIKR